MAVPPGVLMVLAHLSAGQAGEGPPEHHCATRVEQTTLPCTLPVRASPAAVDRLLQGSDWAWWLAGDSLTVIARPPLAGAAGRICCALQMPLGPIPGSTARGVTVRIPRIDAALLDIGYWVPGKDFRPVIYRGPDAPSAPERADPLRGSIERHAIASRALGETRSLSVYVPPSLEEDARAPVIYLADGATTMYAPLLEALIASGDVRPAIIVGIPSADGSASGCAQPGHCDRRNLEYLPHFSSDGSGPDSPFGRHLRFKLIAGSLRGQPLPPGPQGRDRERATLRMHYSSVLSWTELAAQCRSERVSGFAAREPQHRALSARAALLIERAEQIRTEWDLAVAAADRLTQPLPPRAPIPCGPAAYENALRQWKKALDYFDVLLSEFAQAGH